MTGHSVWTSPKFQQNFDHETRVFSAVAYFLLHFTVFVFVAPSEASDACVAAVAMGAYLSEPLTEKHSQDEEDGRFKVRS